MKRIGVNFFSVLAGALVLLAGSLAVAESAVACDCAVEKRPTLRGFDAAATARLIEVKNEDANGNADLVYRVLRVYKGPTLEEGEKLVIKDSRGEATCGLPRRTDRRYGLRLGRTERGLTGSLCTLLGPKQLRRAAERSGDLREKSAACGSTASAA